MQIIYLEEWEKVGDIETKSDRTNWIAACPPWWLLDIKLRRKIQIYSMNTIYMCLHLCTILLREIDFIKWLDFIFYLPKFLYVNMTECWLSRNHKIAIKLQVQIALGRNSICKCDKSVYETGSILLLFNMFI